MFSKKKKKRVYKKNVLLKQRKTFKFSLRHFKGGNDGIKGILQRLKTFILKCNIRVCILQKKKKRKKENVLQIKIGI